MQFIAYINLVAKSVGIPKSFTLECQQNGMAIAATIATAVVARRKSMKKAEVFLTNCMMKTFPV